MKNYGFINRKDPEYWNKLSGAIKDDGSLSLPEKMQAWGELVAEFKKDKDEKSARAAKASGDFSYKGKQTKDALNQELKSLKAVGKDHITDKDKARIKEIEALLNS